MDKDARMCVAYAETSKNSKKPNGGFVCTGFLFYGIFALRMD